MKKNIPLFFLFFAAFPLFSFETTYVEANHAKLFCQSMGEGAPVIVIHGGPGLSQDYLLPGMTRLSETNQVVFYDQRCSGRTEDDGDPEKRTLSVFADDLEAVRRAFGFEKVSVVGHSWGGLVAMKYAIDYPGSVDRLVLLNSMMASSEDFAVFGQNWNRCLSPFIEELERIKKTESYLSGDPDTVETFFKTLFRPYFALSAKADEVNFRATVEENLKWIETWNHFQKTLFSQPFDYLPDLQKLTCPALVVHGNVDVIPLSSSENLCKNIPGSKLIVMEECGHFPYVEKPDELFGILNDFLDP